MSKEGRSVQGGHGLEFRLAQVLVDEILCRRVAGDFAFQALSQQGIDPIAFVDAMHALERAHPETSGAHTIRYLSSHPLDEDRIARAEAASAAFRLKHGVQ